MKKDVVTIGPLLNFPSYRHWARLKPGTQSEDAPSVAGTQLHLSPPADSQNLCSGIQGTAAMQTQVVSTSAPNIHPGQLTQFPEHMLSLDNTGENAFKIYL